MSEPTSCAGFKGCLCARCRRPLTVEGHPHAREQAPSDVPRFQSARKVKPSCWRDDVGSAWAQEQAIRTALEVLRRVRKG